jgi:hypothetical protein
LVVAILVSFQEPKTGAEEQAPAGVVSVFEQELRLSKQQTKN